MLSNSGGFARQDLDHGEALFHHAAHPVDPPLLGVLAYHNVCESAPKRDSTSDRPQLLDTLKEFLFRVGPRSAPIGTPTSGVLAGDFSDLLLFWPGSRFGADSQIFAGWRPAAPMVVAAVVRSRRLAVADREVECGEEQREQDRDDRCRDRGDVHLRASPVGAPSWSRESL